MPATPELLRVAGLIRRVEVLRQVEAHEQRDADSDVGVAGEVRINLHRVGEQGEEVLEAGEEHRALEHAVDEVDGEVVGKDDLLEQTVQDPEHRYAKLPAGEEERTIELRHELRSADDRSGYELREERDVEAEVEDVFHRLNLAAVDIHGVGDNLEDIERYAHRQDNAVHEETSIVAETVAYISEDIEDLNRRAEQVVEDVREEVRVLEVEEQGKVDHYAQQ